jgi:hypothetical protein
MILTGYKQKFATSQLSFESIPKLRIQHWAALLLISFIVGFRYEVGVDWEGYKAGFEFIKSRPHLHFSDQYMEIGFFYINKIIAKVGLSYTWMFFSMAVITWYFFFKSVPKFLLPLFIFFLFADEFFFWGMNGVRQFTAMSIWLFSIRYITNKKLLKYLLIIFIASLFHRSVLILLPFYFIPFGHINKQKIWIGLFIVTLIIGSSNIFLNFIQSILVIVGQKIPIIGLYARYINSNVLEIATGTKIGLGFLFKTCINLLIILVSQSVIKKYPQVVIYFVLFFIGAILFNLSYNIQLLGRLNNYFIIMRSVVLAISIWHFWQTPKYRILIISFVSLYFILFLTAIFNASNMCSPFQFSFMQ